MADLSGRDEYIIVTWPLRNEPSALYCVCRFLSGRDEYMIVTWPLPIEPSALY